MSFSWFKKNDVSAINKCIFCKKSIKKNEIYANTTESRVDPYSGLTLKFDFNLHKNCLEWFLDNCPYQSVRLFKKIDLKELDIVE